MNLLHLLHEAVKILSGHLQHFLLEAVRSSRDLAVFLLLSSLLLLLCLVSKPDCSLATANLVSLWFEVIIFYVGWDVCRNSGAQNRLGVRCQSLVRLIS